MITTTPFLAIGANIGDNVVVVPSGADPVCGATGTGVTGDAPLR